MDMDMDHSPFLDMPELVRDRVLGYLSTTDFLSLRRVCKTTKCWIEEFSATRRRLWNNISLTIEFDGWKSFDAAVGTGLPISSFVLENEAQPYIYYQLGLWEFERLVGPSIKRLRVRSFFACASAKERQFFECLTNLEELQLDTFDATDCSEIPKFPKTFQKLKSLKIGWMIYVDGRNDPQYAWSLLDSCPGLEVFGYPNLWPGDGSETELQPLMNYMKRQEENRLGPLQVLDLKHFHTLHVFQNTVTSFRHFILFLESRNLKLLNVNARLIDSATPATVQLYECIESVQNLVSKLRHLELNQLEKLSVDVYLSSVAKEFRHPAIYPKLRKIKVDFGLMVGSKSEVRVVHWLLRDYERPSIQSLSLNSEHNGKLLDWNFLAEGIVRNFQNLTSLKLVEVKLTAPAYLKLWAGLPLLERLLIKDCPGLGMEALVGENLEEPAFLKLTCLRQLTLKPDEMPQLNDDCFLHVFRHMELTEFKIIITSALEQITERGILHLLEGKFAHSIQRLSLEPGAFPDMSEHEFESLIGRFRSIC